MITNISDSKFDLLVKDQGHTYMNSHCMDCSANFSYVFDGVSSSKVRIIILKF